MGIRLLVVDDNPHVSWEGRVLPGERDVPAVRRGAAGPAGLAGRVDHVGGAAAGRRVPARPPCRWTRGSGWSARNRSTGSPGTCGALPRLVARQPADPASRDGRGRPALAQGARLERGAGRGARRARRGAAVRVGRRERRAMWPRRGITGATGIGARAVGAGYDLVGRAASVGGRRIVVGRGRRRWRRGRRQPRRPVRGPRPSTRRAGRRPAARSDSPGRDACRPARASRRCSRPWPTIRASSWTSSATGRTGDRLRAARDGDRRRADA